MESRDKLRGLWDRDPSIPSELRDAIESRLRAVLLSWRDTPYRVHSAVKGRGADCIGFVSAVVDELYRKQFGLLINLAPTGSSHDSEKFIEFFKRCRTLWPVVDSETIGPGDIILDRPDHGHGHIFIAGIAPDTIWHAVHGVGVVCSLTCVLTSPTFYRLQNKHTWI